MKTAKMFFVVLVIMGLIFTVSGIAEAKKGCIPGNQGKGSVNGVVNPAINQVGHAVDKTVKASDTGINNGTVTSTTSHVKNFFKKIF